ncbi:hypothetical protein VP01_4358g2, partial [Puccinia sorghi]
SNNDIVDLNIVNPLSADVKKNEEPDTIMSKTTDTDLMEKLNSVLYKTAIESIPLLTQENFSMWRSRVVNLLDLLKIKKRSILRKNSQVWNHFSMLNYDNSDVNGLITRTRAAIEKMHEKLPKTPELNSISSAITHSGQEMTPDLFLFLPTTIPLSVNLMHIILEPLILKIVAGCFMLIFDLTL